MNEARVHRGGGSLRHFGKPYFITNPIYLKKIPVKLSEQNGPPPKKLSKLDNSSTNTNRNIASYFINIFVSPNVLTWFTTGGPITKTLKHLGLTKHHLETVEGT